jgi:hypothetical protein
VARVPMSPSASDITCPVPQTPLVDDRTDLAVIYDSLFDGEQLDGLYRGCDKGVRLVAVTNRRLMMVETTSCEDRLALTSVPFDRVVSVCYLASVDESVASSTTVGILVQDLMYQLGCRGEEQARELHDLIAWQLVCG